MKFDNMEVLVVNLVSERNAVEVHAGYVRQLIVGALEILFVTRVVEQVTRWTAMNECRTP